jgi:hypothetical protein
MAKKQFSRYPSTKFHKQAKSTLQAKFMELYIHPNIFFLHLSELSTATQDNYPQKTVKKQKKTDKNFQKSKKKTKYRI